MTTSMAQAGQWARGLEGEPVVVSIAVPRDDLAALDSLSFVRGDDDSDDFWSLVSYCRGGGPGHARAVSNGEYDVVYGLVTRAGVKRVYKEYDQVSFHTERSISLLNSLTKGYTRIDD